MLALGGEIHLSCLPSREVPNKHGEKGRSQFSLLSGIMGRAGAGEALGLMQSMKKSHPLHIFLDGTGGAINVSEENQEPFNPLSLLPLPQLDPSTTSPAEPLVLHRSSSQRDMAPDHALSISDKK